MAGRPEADGAHCVAEESLGRAAHADRTLHEYSANRSRVRTEPSHESKPAVTVRAVKRRSLTRTGAVLSQHSVARVSALLCTYWSTGEHD